MIFWARCNGCPPLPLDRSIGQKDKKKKKPNLRDKKHITL